MRMDSCFSHILVATDGSERADKALALAVKMARERPGTRLSAVLVVHDFSTADFVEVVSSLQGDFEQIRQHFADKGRERLFNLLRPHAVQLPIDAVVEVSDAPHAAILATARRIGADLIVMASRGHGPAASALLGSQTQKVLAESEVPVLVVR
jgi:nucleotide-binding universal stress UspA family protein